MRFQKISIPLPWNVIGNSERGGVGGGGARKSSKKPKFLKESVKLNLKFQRGWGEGFQTKKPSMGGAWTFSGINYHVAFMDPVFQKWFQ